MALLDRLQQEFATVDKSKYYTLLTRYEKKWYPQFGDYDKAVVEQERRDILNSPDPAEYILGRDTLIITTGPKQKDIDAAVRKLNGETAAKMNEELFSKLKAAIVPLMQKTPFAVYKGKGLSAQRYRWDLLHASRFDTNQLYKAGLNDSHIDTALRKITETAKTHYDDPDVSGLTDWTNYHPPTMRFKHSMINSLARYAKRGKYDIEHAKRGWLHVANHAAKTYHEKHHRGNTEKWHEAFPLAKRKLLAEHLEHINRRRVHNLGKKMLVKKTKAATAIASDIVEFNLRIVGGNLTEAIKSDILKTCKILHTLKQGKDLIVFCSGEYENADKLIAQFPMEARSAIMSTAAVIHLDPKMVPQQLRGNYTGNKFSAEVTTEMTIPQGAGTWSGGSRDIYYAVRLADSKAISLVDTSLHPDKIVEKKINVEPGMVVVRQSEGNYKSLHFYVNPADTAKLLPKSDEGGELSDKQLLVLSIVSSLISSARRDEARRYGISEKEYMQILEELKMKKLVKTNGGIDVSGKNLVTTNRQRIRDIEHKSHGSTTPMTIKAELVTADEICPICGGIAGCDHTAFERQMAEETSAELMALAKDHDYTISVTNQEVKIIGEGRTLFLGPVDIGFKFLKDKIADEIEAKNVPEEEEASPATEKAPPAEPSSDLHISKDLQDVLRQSRNSSSKTLANDIMAVLDKHLNKSRKSEPKVIKAELAHNPELPTWHLPLLPLLQSLNFTVCGTAHGDEYIDVYANNHYKILIRNNAIKCMTNAGLTVFAETITSDDNLDRVVEFLENFNPKETFNMSMPEQVAAAKCGNETPRFWIENNNLLENQAAWVSQARTVGNLSFDYFGKPIKISNSSLIAEFKSGTKWSIAKANAATAQIITENKSFSIKLPTLQRLLTASLRSSENTRGLLLQRA
jgi:hypothetical protein